MLVPALAQAHIERPSYWPLPGADCSVKPCAGGKVPRIRTLASALLISRTRKTRVVCQPGSLTRLIKAVKAARKSGYFIRPTDHRQLSAKQGARLIAINRKLFARCRFHEIQPAVNASHTNDRVVVMPGLYLEPTARSKPTMDPACSKYLGADAHSGGGATGLSYTYQSKCPNDQNLIAVIGRALGPGQDPNPALEDRHGIPNRGRCIRCYLQLEGSGVSADDVIIDAGDPKAGNGGPSAAGHKKDVGIRVDRADGFELRNVTVRHAKEHNIYVLETNGYLLDHFKSYYAGEYAVLTFVEDHGLMQNCDAAGSGDSGLYPGAGAKTGAGRDTKFYPEARYSQEIRYCDSHHNAGGYSGTNGNATKVDHNNFYDNALGFTTDVFTAPGHPGFPQQGDLVEYNNFYSNNFNPYVEGSDVEPSIPAPVGTGLWIAGGNDNVVRYNHFYDNWRRGTMLFAVPDSTICGPPPVGSDSPVPGCEPGKFSTSYRDSFYGNVMGAAPDGTRMRNGVDFWWDNFATNTGNCWYQNSAPGSAITSSPSKLPDCSGGTNPSSSVGTGDAANESELVSCFAGILTGSGESQYDPSKCPWFKTPPKP